GDPLEAPPHSLLEPCDLGERGARDRDEAGIAVLQVDDYRVEVVGPEGARWASLVPLRREHEVIHDELAPALEQVGEGFLPVRPVEGVGPIGFLPREGAALPAQRVALAREGLFLLEKALARREPLV